MLSKIKNHCAANYAIKKVKRLLTECEKLFIHLISDKGLLPEKLKTKKKKTKKKKKLSQLNNKKTNQLFNRKDSE